MTDRPDSRETSRPLESSQVIQMEARGARDENPVAIDSSLHGEHAGAIETHLKSIANIDSKPSPESTQAAREYVQYKTGLMNEVFDENGRVRADASPESMRKLVDLNNGEIAATQARIQSAVRKGDDVLAVAGYSDTGNYLPKSMRETQVTRV